MPRVVALIPIDLWRSRLGLPSLADRTIRGRSVLAHVVRRVARVAAVDEIVLVHPAGQSPIDVIGESVSGKPVSRVVDTTGLQDRHAASRTIARKWSPTAWRGGLGGATVYDELLPAAPLVEAMKARDAEAALLVGGDWPLVDASLCQRVIELHMSNPEAFAMTFTQAPPGLCGMVISRAILEQLTQAGASIGRALAYNPARPQADPIGREVCVTIDPVVRSHAERFICDTPRGARLIDAIAETLGDAFDEADSSATVAAAPLSSAELASLPRQVTLELTPRRAVTGPLTPQHYVTFDRPEMATDLAIRIVGQVAAEPDVVLMLGGLGDALLHDDWRTIVTAARDAGVCSVGIETDLLVDRDVIDAMLDSPVDVVSLRLNADTAATYERVMGLDAFQRIIGNIEHLLSARNSRSVDTSAPGVPWVVPRLVKTNDTLADMETFFDRWMHFAGHAVIEPATTGRCDAAREGYGNGELMPAMSPVLMAPPRRRACRQVERRMTILSDGRVARCDQDWVGDGSAGDVATQSLAEIWGAMGAVREAHREERWGECGICAGCVEWHRP